MNDKLPPTRAEARSVDSKHFFTGMPCKHGHISPRYTINSACVTCTYESKQQRKNDDPELWKQTTRAERKRARERDPERIRKHTREFMRRWRSENPELSNQMMREWRANNPEKAREHDANNSARRRKAVGKYTADDVRKLLRLQGHNCAECKKSVRKSYHVDHIMPLALGGTNWPTNLQILCQRCNQQKHAKHPLDWAREKGRLV